MSAPADVKAAPADAKKTASGLAYKVVKAGTGARHPGATSTVTVHYTGWTTDGKMFDSSVARGMPISFALDGVIKGWTEGVQLMVQGEKTRFWIPQDLAYKGTQPPYGMLVFDIELLESSSNRAGLVAGDLTDRALEAIRQFSARLVGHGTDARPARLRLTHVVLRGAARAFGSTLPPIVFAASASFSMFASFSVGDTSA